MPAIGPEAAVHKRRLCGGWAITTINTWNRMAIGLRRGRGQILPFAPFFLGVATIRGVFYFVAQEKAMDGIGNVGMGARAPSIARPSPARGVSTILARTGFDSTY